MLLLAESLTTNNAQSTKPQKLIKFLRIVQGHHQEMMAQEIKKRL